jgi:hypothetical protein
MLSALDGEAVGSAVWLGLLRHLATWRSRTDVELAQVPPRVWDELVRLGGASGNEDTLRRITRQRERTA